MFIRSKMQSINKQKNRLSLSSTKSQASSIASQVQHHNLYNQKKSIFKDLNEQKTQKSEYLMEKQVKMQSKKNQKQFVHRKLSRSLSKKQSKQYILNLNNRKINLSNVKNIKPELSLSKKQSKQNLFPTIQIRHINEDKIENIHQNSCSQQKNKSRKLRKSNYLNSLNNVNQQKIKLLNEFNSNAIQKWECSQQQNNSSDSMNCQFWNSAITKLSFNISNPKKRSYSTVFNANNERRQFNESQINRIQIQNKVYQIVIPPFNPLAQNLQPQPQKKFHIIGTQTIQQQRQYYEYLKYKRRKQEFETDLQKLFQQLNIIKDDRQLFKQRIQILLDYQNQRPSNQRQKRIFRLKQEMIGLQKKLEQTMFKKCKLFEQYVVFNQNLHQNIQNQYKQINKTLTTYCGIIKGGFQQLQNQTQNTIKFVRITERLQNLIQTRLNSAKQHIQNHIKSGLQFKEQPAQLKQSFIDYKQSIQQYRGLLKNCFGHIKKIPELCYGLYGNVLPDMNLKQKLKNQKNQFQMPQCIKCFNSQWKFHMIIEKNILMQPIFKVMEELFK